MISRKLPSMLIATLVLLLGTACSETTTGLSDRDGNPLEPGYALLGQESDITLDLEAEVLTPGAPVAIILTNGSHDEVGYNLCFHALERRGETGWAEAETGEPRICTAVLHMLRPGDTARYETSLPDPLPPAEYRFRVALHILAISDFRDQVTPTFSVE